MGNDKVGGPVYQVPAEPYRYDLEVDPLTDVGSPTKSGTADAFESGASSPTPTVTATDALTLNGQLRTSGAAGRLGSTLGHLLTDAARFPTTVAETPRANEFSARMKGLADSLSSKLKEGLKTPEDVRAASDLVVALGRTLSQGQLYSPNTPKHLAALRDFVIESASKNMGMDVRVYKFGDRALGVAAAGVDGAELTADQNTATTTLRELTIEIESLNSYQSVKGKSLQYMLIWHSTWEFVKAQSFLDNLPLEPTPKAEAQMENLAAQVGGLQRLLNTKDLRLSKEQLAIFRNLPRLDQSTLSKPKDQLGDLLVQLGSQIASLKDSATAAVIGEINQTLAQIRSVHPDLGPKLIRMKILSPATLKKLEGNIDEFLAGGLDLGLPAGAEDVLTGLLSLQDNANGQVTPQQIEQWFGGIPNSVGGETNYIEQYGIIPPDILARLNAPDIPDVSAELIAALAQYNTTIAGIPVFDDDLDLPIPEAIDTEDDDGNHLVIPAGSLIRFDAATQTYLLTMPSLLIETDVAIINAQGNGVNDAIQIVLSPEEDNFKFTSLSLESDFFNADFETLDLNVLRGDDNKAIIDFTVAQIDFNGVQGSAGSGTIGIDGNTGELTAGLTDLAVGSEGFNLAAAKLNASMITNGTSVVAHLDGLDLSGDVQGTGFTVGGLSLDYTQAGNDSDLNLIVTNLSVGDPGDGFSFLGDAQLDLSTNPETGTVGQLLSTGQVIVDGAVVAFGIPGQANPGITLDFAVNAQGIIEAANLSGNYITLDGDDGLEGSLGSANGGSWGVGFAQGADGSAHLDAFFTEGALTLPNGLTASVLNGQFSAQFAPDGTLIALTALTDLVELQGTAMGANGESIPWALTLNQGNTLDFIQGADGSTFNFTAEELGFSWGDIAVSGEGAGLLLVRDADGNPIQFRALFSDLTVQVGDQDPIVAPQGLWFEHIRTADGGDITQGGIPELEGSALDGAGLLRGLEFSVLRDDQGNILRVMAGLEDLEFENEEFGRIEIAAGFSLDIVNNADGSMEGGLEIGSFEWAKGDDLVSVLDGEVFVQRDADGNIVDITASAGNAVVRIGDKTILLEQGFDLAWGPLPDGGEAGSLNLPSMIVGLGGGDGGSVEDLNFAFVKDADGNLRSLTLLTGAAQLQYQGISFALAQGVTLEAAYDPDGNQRVALDLPSFSGSDGTNFLNIEGTEALVLRDPAGTVTHAMLGLNSGNAHIEGYDATLENGFLFQLNQGEDGLFAEVKVGNLALDGTNGTGPIDFAEVQDLQAGFSRDADGNEILLATVGVGFVELRNGLSIRVTDGMFRVERDADGNIINLHAATSSTHAVFMVGEGDNATEVALDIPAGFTLDISRLANGNTRGTLEMENFHGTFGDGVELDVTGLNFGVLLDADGNISRIVASTDTLALKGSLGGRTFELDLPAGMSFEHLQTRAGGDLTTLRLPAVQGSTSAGEVLSLTDGNIGVLRGPDGEIQRLTATVGEAYLKARFGEIQLSGGASVFVSHQTDDLHISTELGEAHLKLADGTEIVVQGAAADLRLNPETGRLEGFIAQGSYIGPFGTIALENMHLEAEQTTGPDGTKTTRVNFSIDELTTSGLTFAGKGTADNLVNLDLHNAVLEFESGPDGTEFSFSTEAVGDIQFNDHKITIDTQGVFLINGSTNAEGEIESMNLDLPGYVSFEQAGGDLSITGSDIQGSYDGDRKEIKVHFGEIGIALQSEGLTAQISGVDGVMNDNGLYVSVSKAFVESFAHNLKLDITGMQILLDTSDPDIMRGEFSLESMNAMVKGVSIWVEEGGKPFQLLYEQNPETQMFEYRIGEGGAVGVENLGNRFELIGEQMGRFTLSDDGVFRAQLDGFNAEATLGDIEILTHIENFDAQMDQDGILIRDISGGTFELARDGEALGSLNLEKIRDVMVQYGPLQGDMTGFAIRLMPTSDESGVTLQAYGQINGQELMFSLEDVRDFSAIASMQPNQGQVLLQDLARQGKISLWVGPLKMEGDQVGVSYQYGAAKTSDGRPSFAGQRLFKTMERYNTLGGIQSGLLSIESDHTLRIGGRAGKFNADLAIMLQRAPGSNPIIMTTASDAAPSFIAGMGYQGKNVGVRAFGGLTSHTYGQIQMMGEKNSLFGMPLPKQISLPLTAVYGARVQAGKLSGMAGVYKPLASMVSAPDGMLDEQSQGGYFATLDYTTDKFRASIQGVVEEDGDLDSLRASVGFGLGGGDRLGENQAVQSSQEALTGAADDYASGLKGAEGAKVSSTLSESWMRGPDSYGQGYELGLRGQKELKRYLRRLPRNERKAARKGVPTRQQWLTEVLTSAPLDVIAQVAQAAAAVDPRLVDDGLFEQLLAETPPMRAMVVAAAMADELDGDRQPLDRHRGLRRKRGQRAIAHGRLRFVLSRVAVDDASGTGPEKIARLVDAAEHVGLAEPVFWELRLGALNGEAAVETLIQAAIADWGRHLEGASDGDAYRSLAKQLLDNSPASLLLLLGRLPQGQRNLAVAFLGIGDATAVLENSTMDGLGLDREAVVRMAISADHIGAERIRLRSADITLDPGDPAAFQKDFLLTWENRVQERGAPVRLFFPPTALGTQSGRAALAEALKVSPWPEGEVAIRQSESGFEVVALDGLPEDGEVENAKLWDQEWFRQLPTDRFESEMVNRLARIEDFNGIRTHMVFDPALLSDPAARSAFLEAIPELMGTPYGEVRLSWNEAEGKFETGPWQDDRASDGDLWMRTQWLERRLERLGVPVGDLDWDRLEQRQDRFVGYGVLLEFLYDHRNVLASLGINQLDIGANTRLETVDTGVDVGEGLRVLGRVLHIDGDRLLQRLGSDDPSRRQAALSDFAKRIGKLNPKPTVFLSPHAGVNQGHTDVGANVSVQTGRRSSVQAGWSSLTGVSANAQSSVRLGRGFVATGLAGAGLNPETGVPAIGPSVGGRISKRFDKGGNQSFAAASLQAFYSGWNFDAGLTFYGEKDFGSVEGNAYFKATLMEILQGGPNAGVELHLFDDAKIHPLIGINTRIGPHVGVTLGKSELKLGLLGAGVEIGERFEVGVRWLPIPLPYFSFHPAMVKYHFSYDPFTGKVDIAEIGQDGKGALGNIPGPVLGYAFDHMMSQLGHNATTAEVRGWLADHGMLNHIAQLTYKAEELRSQKAAIDDGSLVLDDPQAAQNKLDVLLAQVDQQIAGIEKMAATQILIREYLTFRGDLPKVKEREIRKAYEADPERFKTYQTDVEIFESEELAAKGIFENPKSVTFALGQPSAPQEIRDAVRGLAPGQSSEVVALPDGRFARVRVQSITEPPPFKELGEGVKLALEEDIQVQKEWEVFNSSFNEYLGSNTSLMEEAMGIYRGQLLENPQAEGVEAPALEWGQVHNAMKPTLAEDGDLPTTQAAQGAALVSQAIGLAAGDREQVGYLGRLQTLVESLPTTGDAGDIRKKLEKDLASWRRELTRMADKLDELGPKLGAASGRGAFKRLEAQRRDLNAEVRRWSDKLLVGDSKLEELVQDLMELPAHGELAEAMVVQLAGLKADPRVVALSTHILPAEATAPHQGAMLAHYGVGTPAP